MSDALKIEQPITLDLLDLKTPALSSSSDMPVIETKPDSQAEPALSEEVLEETDKTQEQSATSPDSTSENDEPKKAKGVQKRLDELVKQREEERLRAQAAEERLDQALAALERHTVPTVGETPEPMEHEAKPVIPLKADFTDDDAWTRAMGEYADQKAAWAARREVQKAQRELQAKAEQDAIEAGRRAVREAYNARLSKVTEKFPDFKEVAESPDVQISMPVAAAILHAEDGPELQYYLGKHPEEAARISGLPVFIQLMEMGILSARLKGNVAKPVVSAAPKPIKPITPGSEPANKPLEDLSMEEYAQRRKKQMQESRRH